MYKLTKVVRDKIQNKEYKVVDVHNIETFTSGDYVISIGDVTSFNLLKNHLVPNVIIYDGHTKRDEFEYIDILNDSIPQVPCVYEIDNDAGYISNNLWYSVANACISLDWCEQSVIRVYGEEDLAVFPAILFAPVGSWVLFGIPDKGIGFVRVNAQNKLWVMDLLKCMDVCDTP